LLRKSFSSHERSGIAQTLGDFFAPRQRNRSQQLCEDEDAADERNRSKQQCGDEDEPRVVAASSVRTESVRRSSRLSAQAAAAAIAQAAQVTVTLM